MQDPVLHVVCQFSKQLRLKGIFKWQYPLHAVMCVENIMVTDI